MATTFRIVNLGNSVPWGQGLPDDMKYDVLVAEALRQNFPDVSLERLAHSGAVIGAQSSSGATSQSTRWRSSKG